MNIDKLKIKVVESAINIDIIGLLPDSRFGIVGSISANVYLVEDLEISNGLMGMEWWMEEMY